MNTKQVKLGSLCTITSSKRIFESEYVEEGIPFYRSKEIIERESGKTTSSNIHITKERYNEIKEKFGVPKPNEMLITSVGTLGVPYIVKDNDLFYFKDGNLTWLKNFSKALNSRYLYYWIKSDFGKQSLVQRAIGSSQPAITIDILKKYQILIPDIIYQNKIVSVLSIYDDLIEKNNRKIEIFQDMAEELYKEWFVRFRFPGYKTAKFTDGIPDGWETKPLSEWLVDNFNGGWGEEVSTQKTPYKAFVIRGTDIENVKNAIIDDVPHRYHKLNDLNTKMLKENDIVLELSNGNINNIGRTLFVNKQILNWFDKVMCASFCKTLRFEDRETAFLIWQYINYLQNSGLMLYYKNTGANGINNFNFKRFLKMPISIPRHLNCTNDLIEYYDAISLLSETNYNLRRQRDLLLPRLMSGKLAVKVS